MKTPSIRRSLSRGSMTLTAMSVCTGVLATAWGAPAVATPEDYGPPGSINFSNFDNTEVYEGEVAIGDTKIAFVDPAFSNLSLASLHWYKFVYDGVTPIIIDTIGEDSNFGFGGGGVGVGGGDSELAIYDAAGNFVLNNDSVRGINEVYQPPTFVRPDQPADAPPPPSDEEIAARLRQTQNPLTTVNLNYQRTNGSQDPPGAGEEDTRFWAAFGNYQNRSQIALLPGAVAHPDGDPLLDWDQSNFLSAGTYFIAISGDTTFAGDPANTEEDNLDLDSNESSDRNTPFGFFTFHPNDGTIQLNIRRAGDTDLDNDTDADDITALFAEIRAYANTDPMLNGVQFVDNGDGMIDEDDWAGVDDDFVRFDLTGNSRLDIADVEMMVFGVFNTDFGDVDLDGDVDGDDQAVVQANQGLADAGWDDGDMTGDGLVNAADLAFFLASIEGDYNDSGQVEQADLDLVLQNWGLDTGAFPIPTGWTNDLPDGLIDQAELDGVLLNWGSTSAPQFSGAAVPEPGVAACLLACFGGIARRRRGY